MKERTQSTEKHLTLLRPGPGHHALEEMNTLPFSLGACSGLGASRRGGLGTGSGSPLLPPRCRRTSHSLLSTGSLTENQKVCRTGNTAAGDQTWKEAPFPDPRRTGEDMQGCVLESPARAQRGASLQESPGPCPSPGEPGCLDSRWLPVPLRILRSRTYAPGPELARLSGMLSAGDNAALQAHGFCSAGICSGFCKPVPLPPGARNASSRSELQAGCLRRTQVPVAEGSGPV